MGIPKGEEREQVTESLFEEIMTENFLVKEKDKQVQEVQRVPNKMDPRRPTPRHVIIKLAKLKDKERILKAPKEEQLVAYVGSLIRLSSDFSIETFQSRRDWHPTFQVFKIGTYSQGYFASKAII